jgi:RNA polymerase sigma-70 factor (ECF subfamily)
MRRRPDLDTYHRDEELSALPDPDDIAALAVDAIDTSRALALIGSLPRDQAQAVYLRVVVGLDVASAARVLGKRPGAVRTASHRGLRRLAEMLTRRRTLVGHDVRQ